MSDLGFSRSRMERPGARDASSLHLSRDPMGLFSQKCPSLETGRSGETSLMLHGCCHPAFSCWDTATYGPLCVFNYLGQTNVERTPAATLPYTKRHQRETSLLAFSPIVCKSFLPGAQSHA